MGESYVQVSYNQGVNMITTNETQEWAKTSLVKNPRQNVEELKVNSPTLGFCNHLE